MTTYVIAGAVALAVLWFAAPTVVGVIQAKRREMQVRVLTRQTVRAMNRVTKKRDRL